MHVIPDIAGILDNTVISPCAVTFIRVHCRIFICTLLTMAVCMQDLDSAMLYMPYCDLEAKRQR